MRGGGPSSFAVEQGVMAIQNSAALGAPSAETRVYIGAQLQIQGNLTIQVQEQPSVSQPNPLAQPGQISRVITDSRLALEYQHQLKRQGIQVELVNDGPVTIWLDSRARE